MMGGFAMQHLQSSRPASGADHQFSHLWDMQHHKHNGKSVSHGHKVGIGTLSSAGLYEFLYTQDFENLDIDATVAAFPTWEQRTEEVKRLFTIDEIRDKALEEEKEKLPSTDELRAQLTALKSKWPELRTRLQKQLPPRAEMQANLAAVGAPSTPEEIGISQDKLRE